MEDQKELVVGGYRFDRLSDASEAALEIEKATYFEQRISGRSPEICWQFMIRYWMKEFSLRP